MQKETEFVRSMTEKLKIQGDVTQNEATRIFILEMIMYTYEMGKSLKTNVGVTFMVNLTIQKHQKRLRNGTKKCFRGYQIIDKWINTITLLHLFLRPYYARQRKLKRI